MRLQVLGIRSRVSFGGNDYTVWFWVWCWFLIALAAGSQTGFYPYSSRYGKRDEAAAPVFFQSGSRYGRSGDSSGNTKSIPKVRVDRFFLGSRYGKRAKEAEMQPVASLEPLGLVLDYLDREKVDDYESDVGESNVDFENPPKIFPRSFDTRLHR